MDKLVITCKKEDAGTRLDIFLAENTDLSRSFAAKLCDDGNVKIKDICLSKKYKLKGGEVLEIFIPEPEPVEAIPENIPLDIVYEDEHVIVVNKPQGMVVHPAAGNETGTLVNGILYHCKGNLSGINGVVRPGIVHRIDKDTSGLLVVAKTNEAHISLSEQWQSSKPDRQYIALVHENIKEDAFTINLPIGRSKNDRKKMAVVPDGREAVTHVTVLERFSKYTLVKCVLDTGRTHQIRVHMSYNHHAIVGDTVYSSRKEEFSLNGQLLHAQTLGFIHPATNEKMVFSSELPEHFKKVLDVLRRR